MEQERQKRVDQLREEYRQLEEMKQREQDEELRIKKIAEERKLEIEKARLLRENQEEEQYISNQLEQVKIEQGKVESNRVKQEARVKDELERRDFMQMIRQTAENVNQIVEDGHRQLAEER